MLLIVTRTIMCARCLSARMGKRNPWRSCSITPELFAVSRLNEEGRCSQGDYSLFREWLPVHTSKRGNGRNLHHNLVWGEKPWLEKKSHEIRSPCLTNEKLRTGNNPVGFFHGLSLPVWDNRSTVRGVR